MPLTVITLSKVPPSLRGDLTKWMQEIATGVFVGNFNVKVREELWERVKENVGSGQATLSYKYNNEIGYHFETYQTLRSVTDYDGIPLVLFPTEKKEDTSKLKKGFSRAAKYRKAKNYSSSRTIENKEFRDFIVLDIETTGLDYNSDNIIEIGAIRIKQDNVKKIEILVNPHKNVPGHIKQLTGITDKMLSRDGKEILEAMNELISFIGDLPIIGYSVNFDIRFINNALTSLNKPLLQNKVFDLLKFVKKDNMFLDNYRLDTVLKGYEINKKVIHRALSDAELIYELALKMNGFLDDI